MIIVVTQNTEHFQDTLVEDEKLMHTYPNTIIQFTTQKMDEDEDFTTPEPQSNKGTLYLTNKSMYWIDDATKKGRKVSFVDIVMHAIEKTETNTNLYCQLDTDEDQDVSEMRVLADQNEIQNIFKSFSEIALLNPCPNDGEEGGNDDFIFDCEEVRKNSLLHARDDEDEDGDDEPNKRLKTE
jgi:hypothetical protein